MTIRAIFEAATIENASPPYNALNLKIYYPAKMSDSEQERMLGHVPADVEKAPLPVVIFMNGINCGPEAYQWLAVDLAQRGLAVVTYAWVAETLPGVIGITPGINLAMVQPETFGTGPTATALPAIFKTLNKLQGNGLLAGLLNLEQIILGGHSAGGTVALQNANPDYFPQIAGVFSYAAHTVPATMLGFPAGTVLPISAKVPALIIGGTRDGVIGASAQRYNNNPNWNSDAPLQQTFDHGISRANKDSYLIILEGANHFTLSYPKDPTTGRPFLDLEPTQSEADLRQLIAQIIGLFIEGHILNKHSARNQLSQLLQTKNALLNKVEIK